MNELLILEAQFQRWNDVFDNPETPRYIEAWSRLTGRTRLRVDGLPMQVQPHVKVLRVHQGTADSESTFGQDVGVDHGCPHIVVTEKFLDGADVVALFQKAGGEGMPECMTAFVLWNS